MRVCKEPGCSEKHYGRGYCRRHYRRRFENKLHKGRVRENCKQCGGSIPDTRRVDAEFCGNQCQMQWHRRYGCYTEEALLKSRSPCRIKGCDRPAKAHGLCNIHAQHLWRHGDENYQPKEYPTHCKKCGGPIGENGARGFCEKHYHNEYYYGRVGNSSHKNERARRNARRTRVKQATPPWADLKEIDLIYLNCPPGHEVDHVIPLRGKRISGLHVPENLQYLPLRENRRKGSVF